MKVKIEGYSTLIGTPKAILQLMKSARIFDKDMTDDEYIETIQHTIWKTTGIGIEVTGGSTEEKAESLLREMNKKNLIKIEEE